MNGLWIFLDKLHDLVYIKLHLIRSSNFFAVIDDKTKWNQQILIKKLTLNEKLITNVWSKIEKKIKNGGNETKVRKSQMDSSVLRYGSVIVS